MHGIAVSTLRIAQGLEPPVGQKVYAIGSPKGLEASLSDGIISGRREITEGISWLQTTTPISPGSSGGPLLDATGQVVGVVIAHRREGQNLNFAVPASEVIKFLMGPVNTRELWRGSGINGEEQDQYIRAAVCRIETQKGRESQWRVLGFVVERRGENRR